MNRKGWFKIETDERYTDRYLKVIPVTNFAIKLQIAYVIDAEAWHIDVGGAYYSENFDSPEKAAEFAELRACQILIESMRQMPELFEQKITINDLGDITLKD